MRITRIIATPTVLALLALAPAAVPSSAAAAAPAGPGTDQVVVVDGAARAAAPEGEPNPSREIDIDIVGPGKKGKFFITGSVAPTYAERPYVVQRKLENQAKWSVFKTARTDEDSGYRTRVRPKKSPGVVLYRVKTKKTDAWKASFSFEVGLRTCDGECPAPE